jgi:uncharacterized RDD family membrane protein YckC
LHNVTTNLDTRSADIHYAGFSKRFKAFAYDYLLIFAYIAVLFGVNFGIILSAGRLEEMFPFFASPVVKDAIAFLTLILPVVLYFTLGESSPHQATWGKRKVGIRVIDADGRPLTRKRAFLRSLIKLLPWQIAHTSIYHIAGFPFAPLEPSPLVVAGFVLVYLLVGIFVACVLISKDHRTPYDWAAGSFVIAS